MTNLIFIATGGAAGALLRYWMSSSIYSVFGRTFPYGTLSVNVTGSILMGLCYVFLVERTDLGSEWRAGLMIGLLGAFTTFSTYTLESLNLFQDGELRLGLFTIIFPRTGFS